METNSTIRTIHTVVTSEHVGCVWVDRGEAVDLSTGRYYPVVSRFLIEAVQPADDFYYQTCPTAGPRVEVHVRKIQRDGRIPPRHTGQRPNKRWLPTTGNWQTVELERKA